MRLKICLAFWKSEPQYAYKRYAFKKYVLVNMLHDRVCETEVRSRGGGSS